MAARVRGVLVLAIIIFSSFVVLTPKVKASFAEFSDLGRHVFADRVSSLTVVGTAVLYDQYDLSSSSHTISFTNTSIPDLRVHSRGGKTWDDAIRSLKVEGVITLYDDPGYSGRQATFTSDSLPYDDIGTEWNKNPSLVKSNDSWDCRISNWAVGISDIYHGDENNYVKWNQGGLVESKAQDDIGLLWKAVEFNQGQERYENEIANLSGYPRGLSGTWSNCASSLMVEGSVTLYDGVGYTGDNITFTYDVWNLDDYGWNDRVSSLKLTEGSRVTLYYNYGYLGVSKSFACPSYQPPQLKVSDKSNITLEAVVDNWYTSTWTTPGWTGVKFDVYASEDPSLPNANTLMLELYFVRDGDNLAWGNGIVRAPLADNTYNALLAIDCWPQYAQRTVYPGNVAKWKIEIKGIIKRACDDFNSWWGHSYNLDFDKLSIVKIGFTVETAYNLPMLFNPAAGCSLSRLRLAYTPGLTTTLTVGNPKRVDFADLSNSVYVTSGTRFTLSAEDNVGGSVVTTGYRVRNSTYDSGWTVSHAPMDFYLAGLIDGIYFIDYNSTDNVGNVENMNYVNVTLVGPDINGDGKVDMRDMRISINAFHSFPGYPRWNPIADINLDGRVDMRDLVDIAMVFGKHWP